MTYEILLAGFGGQGILSAGRLLAHAGMLEGKHVSWLPSYGPEMRGGTANCSVIISDNPVGSPILNQANILIAMNRPSLEKFENMVTDDGVIIYDSSLIEIDSNRKDIDVYKVPATEIAISEGNKTFANIVILGKLLSVTKMLKRASIEISLKSVLAKSKHHLIPKEMEIFDNGASLK